MGWLARYGFDDDRYLYFNPDVAEAQEAGRLGSPFRHWLAYGRHGQRAGGFPTRIPSRQRDTQRLGRLPWGINHIGFLSGQSGLGTLARGLQRAIADVRIPSSPIDVPSWEERDKVRRGLPPLPYRVNLIQQNIDALPLFLRWYSKGTLRGHYNVGHIVWELPALRADWFDNLAWLDEVWVPSEFCREAVSCFTAMPVEVIPSVVDGLDASAPYSRHDLNLPENRFLFYTVFDVASGFLRKNPLAVIEAFLRVFANDPSVCLLLKFTNSQYDAKRIARLRELTSGSPNILLRDETWTTEQVLSMHRRGDCFVSAHRSEGFGLNLAEALYFGTPVVATDFGGSRDFLTTKTGYPVECGLQPLPEGHGPYPRGALWAEPSVEHLAAQMQRVFVNREESRRRAECGAELVREKYSAHAVGRLIEARLTERGLKEPQPDSRRFRLQPHPAYRGRFVPPDASQSFRERVRRLHHRPRLSIITPVHNVDPRWLDECIESVRGQYYPDWELCLCDDASTSAPTRRALRRWLSRDPRIKIVFSDQPLGISAAANRATAYSTGEYLAFLDHDDTLAPDALLEVAEALERLPAADLLYTDEDKIDESGAYCDHYYKPDWSPDHLHSVMYLLHLLVVRRSLFLELGSLRSDYDGAQDYDLVLRVSEVSSRIVHIPRVLYHWRKIRGSAAAAVDAKSYALEAGARSLSDHVRRAGLDAEVGPGLLAGTFRLRYRLDGPPPVTLCIIASNSERDVPGRGRVHLVSHFVRSILERTDYPDYRILIAADGDFSPHTRESLESGNCLIVDFPGPNRPFNFSRKVNFAVRQVETNNFVLLNDDMEVRDAEWLRALVEHSSRPEIGAAGGKLVLADERIQHAGIVLGVSRGAAHVFYHLPADFVGYNGFSHIIRNFSAVTAACLATRLDAFWTAGGFDERYPIDYNDIDFCLKLRSAGLRIVFTPYCELYHFESSSLPRHQQNSKEVSAFQERWSGYLEADPYYNINLSRDRPDYALRPKKQVPCSAGS